MSTQTAVAAARAPRGLLAWVATTDHKRIALRIVGAALIFFVAGGLIALVMRSQLADPGAQLVGRDTYNQLFTMHGSTMIYLVVTPVALALGVYLVPLQVGAADIAGPRLTLFGHWLIVAGGLTMYSGFLTDHGAGKAGWTGYVPLSASQGTPGTGMDLWIIGVLLAALGSFVLGATVLATVLKFRAPGMTMLRLPVFSWTMVATCLMVVMIFPVLVVAMALLLAERHLGGVFDSAGGPITYIHLFWFYGHPVVYVMFFPFLGAVAEVVAVFSRKRFFGYRPLIVSLLIFAGGSMSVWAHHMFTTGQVTNQYFSLTSTALAIPAGIEYFDILGTMWGGKISLRTPMLFALGFLVQFLIGGLTGVMLGSPPLNYDVHGSYFIVAHFHYTLFAGSMFGLFAAIYYWFPKVTGVFLREGLGKLNFVLLFVGTNLTFFPMFILGYDGMVRRVATYPSSTGFQGLNIVSTIGAFIIASGIAVFLLNLVLSLRDRRPAGDDPWEGHTLEWATSSPPPRFNFHALPPIRSYAPLFDLRHGEQR